MAVRRQRNFMIAMLNDDLEFFKIIYRFFADGTKLTYAAIGISLFVAFLYFRIFFRDVAGFEEDVENTAGNDHVNSRWSNGKITVWLLLSVGCGIAAYYQLPQWFPHWFKTK